MNTSRLWEQTLHQDIHVYKFHCDMSASEYTSTIVTCSTVDKPLSCNWGNEFKEAVHSLSLKRISVSVYAMKIEAKGRSQLTVVLSIMTCTPPPSSSGIRPIFFPRNSNNM